MAGYLGKGRFGCVLALAVVTCTVAGCLSDPLSGQRVDPYRPSVDSRDVVLDAKVTVRPSTPSTTNDTGGDMYLEPIRETSRALRSGDKVAIYLFGIPDPAELNDVIDDRGNVNLPLIQSVKIAGKTTYEAEKMIESAYVDGGYYRKIEVSLVPLSVLPRTDECYVRGEVKAPGRYPWTADLTLMKAIIAAGGFTEFANPRKVQVRRGEEASQVYDTKEIEKDKIKDPPVNAGDMINVRRGLM